MTLFLAGGIILTRLGFQLFSSPTSVAVAISAALVATMAITYL